MGEYFVNILLVLLAIPPALTALVDLWSILKRNRSPTPASTPGTRSTPSLSVTLRGFSVLFTALLIALLAYVMVTGGIGLIKPFIAYYGDSGDLRVVGSKVDNPIALPHHIGCPSQTGIPVETALKSFCGSNATPQIDSIGQSGGGNCGFNVFAGACVRKGLFGFGG